MKPEKTCFFLWRRPFYKPQIFFSFSWVVGSFLLSLVLSHEDLIAGACSDTLKKALNYKNYPSSDKIFETVSHKCPLERKILMWDHMRRGPTNLSLKQYKNFIDNHSDWPWLFKVKQYYERRFEKQSPKEVLAYFKDRSPSSLEGALALVGAHLHKGDKKKARQAAKEAWIKIPLNSYDAKIFRQKAGSFLTEQDHFRKARYWLGQNNYEAAKPGLSQISDKKKSLLLKAQAALVKSDKKARSLYNKAKVHFKKDYELQLSYLKWLRRTHNDYASTYLLRHPEMIRYAPERSWKEIHILMRRALEEGKAPLAAKLAKAHDLKREQSDFYDAEWLKAWFLLRQDKAFSKAQEIFERGYREVSMPISKGRFAYWAGLAAEKKQSDSEARAWYAKAAAYPETFYGQQALQKLGIKEVPSPPSLQADKKRVDSMKRKELFKAAATLLKADQPSLAQNFLHMLMKSTQSEAEENAVLKAVQTLSPEHLVGLSKETTPGRNLYFKELYPVLSKRHHKAYQAVDPILFHSVVRKESLFDSRLVSWAGAMGLSQLVAPTAKSMAKSLGLKFNKKKLLTDSAYNTHIGAAYLATRLDKFDDYSPLALVAYNAGIKYAYEWQEMFGDPRSGSVDLVDWIESLPFGETRNYLQRVLENQTVYRCVLNKKCASHTFQQRQNEARFIPELSRKPKRTHGKT